MLCDYIGVSRLEHRAVTSVWLKLVPSCRGLVSFLVLVFVSASLLHC